MFGQVEFKGIAVLCMVGIEVDEAIVPAVGFNLGSASSVCGWTTYHLPGKGDPPVEGLRLGKHEERPNIS